MILGVDGRHLTAFRGVARHTRGMLSALATSGAVGDLRILVPGRIPVDAIAGTTLVRSRAGSRLLHGSGALIGRPTLASLTGADLVWIPAPAPCAPGSRYVLTIHDLSWLERSADFTAYERLWHRAMRFERLLRGATAVTAVSAPVAEALEQRFGVAAHVIEAGISVLEPRQREHARPYFLYVGALEPRKGLDVLDAAWQLARPDADLLLAGTGRVRIGSGEHLGLVDDQTLHDLYAEAEALILPSLLEGYGLTPREAAAHGVPSIVSDLPVLRMPGTLRVPPGDVQALADAIVALPAERDRLVAELGPARGWDTAATELEKVFRSVLR